MLAFCICYGFVSFTATLNEQKNLPKKFISSRFGVISHEICIIKNNAHASQHLKFFTRLRCPLYRYTTLHAMMVG